MHCVVYTGSWTRPPNWDLSVTLNGEPRIPFSIYVKGEPSSSPNSTFPQFCSLPIELQTQILGFCDGPTLFSLMHVSSGLRSEAKKLFWSIPDAWYLVEGKWLFAGGLSGLTYHAMDVSANIQRVEVNFSSIGHDIKNDEEAQICRGGIQRSFQSPEERARILWRTLQHHFPKATHVVISENKSRKPRGWVCTYEDYGRQFSGERPPQELVMIAQMSPSGIRTSVSFLRRISDTSNLLERTLWQRTGESSDTSGEWEEVNSAWTRQSILLPPKEFRGPVGIFQNAFYQDKRIRLQENAIPLLRLEARERHQFHKRREPFACFEPGCDATFERPGEWTLHALGLGCHDTNAEVPNELKAAFEEHEKMIDHRSQGIKAIWRKMREDYGDEGSEKWHRARQAFLHQLDHDPLYTYGKPAAQTSAWVLFTQLLGPDDQGPIC